MECVSNRNITALVPISVTFRHRRSMGDGGTFMLIPDRKCFSCVPIKDIRIDGSDQEKIGLSGNCTMPGGMWRGEGNASGKT